jgi:hypothetical protein
MEQGTVMGIKTIFVIAVLVGLTATASTAILSQQAKATSCNAFFDEQSGALTKFKCSSQKSFENSNSEVFHNHDQNIK